MREVFKPENGERLAHGRLFYTITREDIGRRQIRTTECLIPVGDVIGYVQERDVGKRLYRLPTNGGIKGQPVSWIWQAESDEQRDRRLAEANEKR